MSGFPRERRRPVPQLTACCADNDRSSSLPFHHWEQPQLIGDTQKGNSGQQRVVSPQIPLQLPANFRFKFFGKIMITGMATSKSSAYYRVFSKPHSLRRRISVTPQSRNLLRGTYLHLTAPHMGLCVKSQNHTEMLPSTSWLLLQYLYSHSLD